MRWRHKAFIVIENTCIPLLPEEMGDKNEIYI